MQRKIPKKHIDPAVHPTTYKNESAFVLILSCVGLPVWEVYKI